MSSSIDDPTHRQYEALFETFQLDETVLQGAPAETIKLDPRDAATTLESLPTFHLTTTGSNSTLDIGRTLGEGGMGIVRAATQSPFGREVALKTVREDRSADSGVTQSLLQEAIVTGRLEHPNIVPIYAVGQDERGLPVIVMKRIDGKSWRELLDEPSQIPSDDPLEWNLRTFMQACAAIHFAHQLGVVHRDIKPDNVMIGSHEDIYVVDWGLAVATKRGEGGLPWVGDVSQVAGTPCYMAPEMASGGKEPIGIWSDVYLLGALLHELVTGTPRHDGASVYPILLAAYRSEPVEYGPEVAAELAAICNRATSRKAEERFASAQELREAVADFLDHRSAASLAQEAARQLEALEAALRDSSPVEERRVAVYRLYGAARFGFERALAEWPGQPNARDGLQRTLEQIIDWELEHGSPHAAAAALADLPLPRPQLAARIAEVERELGERDAELETLRERDRQQDIRLGTRTRAFHALIVLAFGLVLPGVLRIFGVFDPLATRIRFWLLSVIVCGGIILFLALVWRVQIGPFELHRTETNRKVVSSVALVSVFLPLFRGLGLLVGVEMSLILALEMAVFALFTAQLAVVFDHRIAPAAAGYVAAIVAVYAFPQHSFTLYMAGSAVAMSWIAWVWSDLVTPTQR